MAEGVGLTELEKRILRLLGQGKGDVEIANELAIPFDDAKRGVQSVMRKLGVATREEAAAKGRRGGRRWLPRMDGLVGWIADTRSGQATVAGLIGIGIVLVLGFAWFGGGGDEAAARVRFAQVLQTEDGVFTLRVTEVGVEEPLLEISPEAEFFFFPRFSPDGSKVAAMIAVGDEGEPSLARVASVDLANQTFQRSDPVRSTALGAISWSPDGTRFATAGAGISVFDDTARLLSEVEPTDESGGGFQKAVWSPDSQNVAAVLEQTALFIGTRDGRVRKIALAELAEPTPGGLGVVADRDTLQFVEWDEDGRLRLILLRLANEATTDDRDSESGLFEARGFVRGTDIGWSSLMRLSVEEEEAMFGGAVRERADLREQAQQLVAGTTEQFVSAFPPWRTADGGTWVLVVPYGEPAATRAFPDTVKAIVFLDDPAIVELEDHESGLRGTPPGSLDVVVIQE